MNKIIVASVYENNTSLSTKTKWNSTSSDNGTNFHCKRMRNVRATKAKKKTIIIIKSTKLCNYFI